MALLDAFVVIRQVITYSKKTNYYFNMLKVSQKTFVPCGFSLLNLEGVQMDSRKKNYEMRVLILYIQTCMYVI